MVESNKTEGRVVVKGKAVKIFRNIWLFSMLAFLIVFVLYALIGKTFNINEYSGVGGIAFIVMFGLIGLVGGISFLIWISILIFSNKFSRIVTILLGIFISGLYALTVYSVTYIYVFSRVSQESTDPLVFLDLLLPLAVFGLALYIWLKTKPILIKAVILFILIAAYLTGRNYAIKAYEPLKQAFNLINQANSRETMAWTKETDENLYLDGERKWVTLFEGAAGLIKTDVFRSGARNYFNNLYQVQNEGLHYDEQIISKELLISKEEADKTIAEIAKKREAAWLTFFSIPFWTEFFMVK